MNNKIFIVGCLTTAIVMVGLAAGSAARKLVTRQSLPHRPLSEIDIQGHQPEVTHPNTDPCPGQYGYYLYRQEQGWLSPEEVIVYCWGKR